VPKGVVTLTSVGNAGSGITAAFSAAMVAVAAVADPDTIQPANEVDDARWITLADAEGILTYEHDRAMLDRISEVP
jgi:NADH pyrophosphatase NudC (nudix superfamily)